MYLLNDGEHILQGIPLENNVDDDNKLNEMFDIVDKRKYKQSDSECKKFRTFIKTVVSRNIAVTSEK